MHLLLSEQIFILPANTPYFKCCYDCTVLHYCSFTIKYQKQKVLFLRLGALTDTI